MMCALLSGLSGSRIPVRSSNMIMVMAFLKVKAL
jgi:hypothetical protein